jgi:hypothetical protein
VVGATECRIDQSVVIVSNFKHQAMFDLIAKHLRRLELLGLHLRCIDHFVVIVLVEFQAMFDLTAKHLFGA